MGPKRTYILSIHEPGGRLVLEDVRTRRRAPLADLDQIGEVIERWREEVPDLSETHTTGTRKRPA